MLKLIKPAKLEKGDKIAAVSLSRGTAGDAERLWRYNVGKKRLAEEFGLEVVETPNTLMGSRFLYAHPEKRAEDLMLAFADKSIKGIFTCIGGDDSIRLLPYIDFNVIKNNPKVFLGYSDTTVAHFMCLKAGLSSFYGASILREFAQNVNMFGYTKEWILKTLFSDTPPGDVPPSPIWAGEYIPWDDRFSDAAAKTEHCEGYELLQGHGKASGPLIGGCIDTLEMLKGTALWPEPEAFDGAVLFLETSEETPPPAFVEYWLRNYGAQGVLGRLSGIIWGKPYHNKYFEEYKKSIKKVVAREFGLSSLPILYNMNFGHNEPMTCLPYGAGAEIDCENACFSISDSCVL